MMCRATSLSYHKCQVLLQTVHIPNIHEQARAMTSGMSLSSKHYLSVNSPHDRYQKYLLLYSLDIPYAICFHISNLALDSDHNSSVYSLRRNLSLKSNHLSIPWIKHQRSWGWDTGLRFWRSLFFSYCPINASGARRNMWLPWTGLDEVLSRSVVSSTLWPHGL